MTRPELNQLPGALVETLKAKRGRPVGSDRQQVPLRLPLAVIDHFKQGGPGWQTRAIAVLEREVRKAS